jgi:hypothetical protein
VSTRALGLAAFVFFATACTGNAAREALDSLKSETLSPKHHSGFWADEAGKQTALWKEAPQLCRAQEARPTPNCRVVYAVDLTVRIIAVHQDEDGGERLKAWLRGGSRELGLPTPGSMPPPTKGFGPEPPKMPASAGK